MVCGSIRGVLGLVAVALALGGASSGCGGDSNLFSSGGATSSTTSSGGATTSSGDGGATTSSGSGGMTSSGGGAGGASSSGAGGDNPEGSPCDWGGAPCAGGLYCDAPGCAGGVCAPIAPPSAEQGYLAPVCGCDGVSYYNDTVAKTHGMSVAHGDGCGDGELVPCEPLNAPCAPGQSCNMRVNDPATCYLSPTHEGSCWAMPSTCAPDGPPVHSCKDLGCYDVCILIKKQIAWYEGGGCF